MNRNRDALWDGIALALPIALAIMGAVLTIWPPDPDGKGRLIWLAAFLVVGIASLVATLRASRTATRRIEELTTGGENFCFFRVQPSELRKSASEFQLWLQATGPVYDINYWISPASAKRNGRSADYMSIDHRKMLLPVVYKGPRAWDRTLPLGDYFIEFDGRNGTWVERLTLALAEGIVSQRIQVTDELTGRQRINIQES